MSNLWGFDPSDLLKRVSFPNDLNEYKIRHLHRARLFAVRQHSSLGNPKRGKIIIAFPGNQGEQDSPIGEELRLDTFSQIQQDQLARSAAAIIIQAKFRGWSTRKRYSLIITAILSLKTNRDGALADSALPMERVRRKWIRYGSFFDNLGLISPEYSQYCATLIQAYWRRFVVQRAYQKIGPSRLVELKEGDARGEETTKAFFNTVTTKERFKDNSKEIAARRIQRNSRIYRLYRDLIKVREGGEPYKMLRYINPKEADMIDRSLSLHIRFRLGGFTFPPTIFYKIFVHNNLIDMNSFSPRDYCAKNEVSTIGCTGWYQREEANNWRPVNEQLNFSDCSGLIESDPQKISFHYSKVLRKSKISTMRRKRKLEWMKKLYSNIECHSAEISGNEEFQIICDNRNEDELIGINARAEDQVLLDWTSTRDFIADALDYDLYHKEWIRLATSAPSRS